MKRKRSDSTSSLTEECPPKKRQKLDCDDSTKIENEGKKGIVDAISGAPMEVDTEADSYRGVVPMEVDTEADSYRGVVPMEVDTEADSYKGVVPMEVDTEADGIPASQNPNNIITISGPTDLGCGGFEWKIWFELPEAAGQSGWIIQEITATFDIEQADGSRSKTTHHYWEAWEVEKAKKVTVCQDKGLNHYDDNYHTTSFPGTKGKIEAVGKAKFYECALPSDFKTNNPNTLAGILHATTNKPYFWDGSGTDHNITNTWDCT